MLLLYYQIKKGNDKMIIEEKITRNTFDKLEEGQLFYYVCEDCYCIKTDETDRAVVLESGLIIRVDNHDDCIPINGKVVIE